MEAEKVTINSAETPAEVKIVFESVVPEAEENQKGETKIQEEIANENDGNDTYVAITKISHDNVESQTKSTVTPECDAEENKNALSSLGRIALEYDDVNSASEESCTELPSKQSVNDENGIEMEMHSYRVRKDTSSDESDSEDDSSSWSNSPAASLSDQSDSDDNTTKNDKAKNVNKNAKELKNEWDDLPPIEDLHISVPEVLCEPLGQVAWMVEQLVVVEPKGGKPTLNLDTVLFVERGKRALGKIFDVFGPVNEPYYCVRFNTTEHIKESDIKEGMPVYFCPNSEYTSLVFLHELMKLKGTDDVGDGEQPEFSDDEEEQLYYKNLQNQQRNKTNEGDVPCKKRRVANNSGLPMGWKTNNPWNRNPQNTERQSKNHPRQTWHRLQDQWPPTDYTFGAYTNGNYAMQYHNYATYNANPNFAGQHHNYQGDRSAAIFPSPRPSYGIYPRYPTSFSQNASTNMPHPNLRFRQPNMSWPAQSQMSNENTTWVALPPPPPPPPPPSEGT